MPIEFRCTACGKLLRTPDETAGKQAKCPECGAVMAIPVPAAPPHPPTGSPFVAGGGPTAAGAANPYQSPISDAAAVAVPPPGSFAPSRIDFADVFGRTFRIFGQEWSQCIVAFLALSGVSLAAVLVIGGPAFALAVVAQDEVVTVVVAVLGIGTLSLIVAWLSIGWWIFFLKLARGDDAEVADLFRGGPFFVTTVLATLLFALVYLGGLALFIVPGVIFWLMFSQYNYMIIDRNAGVLESLSLSKEFTYGNKLTLFAILLVAGLVGGLINQACGLAVIVVAPFMALLHAVIYLVMTGQATVDLRYPGGPVYYQRPQPPYPPAAGSPFGPPPPTPRGGPKIGGPGPNNP